MYPYQHDLNYLKARHAERLREMGIGRSYDPAEPLEIRERLFSALGDVLIDWGRKLKGEMEIKELGHDCA